MLGIEGFRILRSTPGGVEIMTFMYGNVERKPKVRYRNEYANAFDPTMIHRTGRYHEDTIECQTDVSPEEYLELESFLDTDDDLYVEFDIGAVSKQFPVVVSKMPELDDENRAFDNTVKMTFISKYSSLADSGGACIELEESTGCIELEENTGCILLEEVA